MQRGQNGDGYVYYRDRSRGNDATVCEHTLMLLVEHDPHEVFDPDVDVHHEAPVRDANVPNLPEYPTFLSLVDRREHRSNGGDKYAVWKNPEKG